MNKIILIISSLVMLISLTAPIYLLYSYQPPILFTSTINRPWPSPIAKPNPSPSPQIQSKTISSSKTPKQIPQAELWQALITYRQTHKRNPLVLEESLCIYAQSRLQEHQQRLTTLGQNESPLDNHSGFQRDAESGSIFADTGFTTVAEVLAFLPNAKTGTQVMEWGWDSSPAHREGLLSNEMTHACVVGATPFYVGILGKR